MTLDVAMAGKPMTGGVTTGDAARTAKAVVKNNIETTEPLAAKIEKQYQDPSRGNVCGDTYLPPCHDRPPLRLKQQCAPFPRVLRVHEQLEPDAP